MTKLISLLVLIVVLLSSCSKTKFESHDHSVGEATHDDHGHGGGEIENIRFTEFSQLHEMFTEMTPLIQGKESEFVVHFTKLSDFKPVMNGNLTILMKGAINEVLKVDSIKRAGIFITSYTPNSVGDVEISFIYSDGIINDTIEVMKQKCYTSLDEAKKEADHDEEGITFLKEESWKIDFALTQIKETDYSETVKSSGRIINLPSDEIIISANTSGIVEILDYTLSPGKNISSGTNLFSIKSGSLREDNLELKYTLAKSNYDKSKKEFDRIIELYKSKISSEREYLEAKTSLESTEAIFKNYSNTSDGKKTLIKSPKSGFLKNLAVNQGQFVEAGATLAILSNNTKLMIQVDLPISEYSKLKGINNANLIINNRTINIKEVNGKLVGNPISAGNSGFVSIYFQIDNKLNLLPNTHITVYLFGTSIPNSLIIPKESLWEDQGNYFVFVQKHGELYEKREITINGFDGINYLIGSGLKSGDVIVSKGTYRVMLASKSSELPANSHAH